MLESIQLRKNLGGTQHWEILRSLPRRTLSWCRVAMDLVDQAATTSVMSSSLGGGGIKMAPRDE